jgi:hypothetical protein
MIRTQGVCVLLGGIPQPPELALFTREFEQKAQTAVARRRLPGATVGLRTGEASQKEAIVPTLEELGIGLVPFSPLGKGTVHPCPAREPDTRFPNVYKHNRVSERGVNPRRRRAEIVWSRNCGRARPPRGRDTGGI